MVIVMCFERKLEKFVRLMNTNKNYEKWNIYVCWQRIIIWIKSIM